LKNAFANFHGFQRFNSLILCAKFDPQMKMKYMTGWLKKPVVLSANFFTVFLQDLKMLSAVK
jgi:hypothetical protein